MYTANLGPAYPPDLAGSISSTTATEFDHLTGEQPILEHQPETSGISPSQIVLDPGPTTTTVTSTPASPITPTTPITFTATISDYTDVGTVTFYAGPGQATQIGSPVPVVNDQATSVPTTLPGGSYSIIAYYSGGIGFASSYGSENLDVNSAPAFTGATGATVVADCPSTLP